jgi:hypothetical protein
MEGVKRMGIVDFRADVGRRVDAAHFGKEMTVVTKGSNEEPRALLIPYEWREILLEGLAARGIVPPIERASVRDD